MQTRFSTCELSKLSGVRYETLDAWARMKILEPSVEKAAGSGTNRIYDVQDLRKAIVIRALRILARGDVIGDIAVLTSKTAKPIQ